MSLNVDGNVSALYGDGVTALAGAFSRPWGERLREDMMTAFWEAIQRPGGAVGRGPRRWYVEVHPQQISGFVDLVTHPWHRDFPSRIETYQDRRLTSLAFNLTGVDVTEDVGPFEIAWSWGTAEHRRARRVHRQGPLRAVFRPSV